MYIGLTDEQQALRQELRDYYAQLLTPEVEARIADSNGVGPAMRAVVKQMRAGAPVPMLTINTVGPTIFRYGTDEQKDRFLPQILRGEIHFCIGYTEPG